MFEGTQWSVVLPYADNPEKTYGWISAEFYDHGVAMMALREYATVDATVDERSVQVLELVRGRWVRTVLMDAGAPGDESSPIEVATSGDRIAVAAYPPSVDLFTRTSTGWSEVVVTLAEIVGEEFSGELGSADRIAVALDSNRYALVEWDGSQWVPEVFSMESPEPCSASTVSTSSGAPANRWSSPPRIGDGWTVRPLTPVVSGHNFGSSVDVDDGRVLVAANGATPGPGTSARGVPVHAKWRCMGRRSGGVRRRRVR